MSRLIDWTLNALTIVGVITVIAAVGYLYGRYVV